MNKQILFLDYPYRSRIHPLNSFGKDVFVKRDDELSFGITGSKYRKYLSLIPYLIKQNVKEVVLIGGAYSNHVVGCAQLLIENGITPIPFLLERSQKKPVGNLLFTEMMCPEIHWIARGNWDNVQKIANDYAVNRERCVVIPEGASMNEALPGAKSLSIDIERNQRENGLIFDHILIDAGTGMTARGLIEGAPLKSHIHILALAKCTFPNSGNPYTLHRPQNAKSFGSVNRRVFQTIRDVARKEGILLDPIYSAKLFDE
ncbi:MAG: hypothetical protein KAR79_04885, partial [Simkaniaceae bacterium]|nr:hypothetical protein [Simkaniaceae bacterium]